MSHEPLSVVLGAGGGIGAAVVEVLATEERRVRGAARRVVDVPAGVELVRADVTEPEQLRAALDGADVVYQCAMPAYGRWAQEFPAMMGGIADVCVAAEACLVVADNLYASRADGKPISESDSPVHHGAKSETRARMSKDLLGRADLRATFGRGADYYGVGQRGLHSVPGETLFERAIAGKRMTWPGRTDVPHALHGLGDLARALVMLADNDVSWGRAWNLPSPEPLTGRGYADAIAKAMGGPTKLTRIPIPILRLAGLFDSDAREVTEISWQFDRPFLIDDSAFRSEIGALDCRPHEEQIGEVVAWHRSRGSI